MMDDLISRQAAIDAVKHAWHKGLYPVEYIEELPTVQPDPSTCWGCNCPKMDFEHTPEQKKGKWREFRVDDDGVYFYFMYGHKECGCVVSRQYKFCPNCGAEMET